MIIERVSLCLVALLVACLLAGPVATSAQARKPGRVILACTAGVWAVVTLVYAVVAL